MTQVSLRDFRPLETMTPEQEAAIRNAQPQRPGFFQSADAATGAANTATRALIARTAADWYFAEDPDFRLTPNAVKELGDGIPTEWWDEFGRAYSQDQAVFIRQQLLQRQEDLDVLARDGWRGMGLQLAAGLTDPIELGVQVGANALVPGGGLLAKAAQSSGTLRRAATAGLVFGLTDAALMAGTDALSPEDYSAADYSLAVLASFTLGGALEYRSLRKAGRSSERIAARQATIDKMRRDIEFDMLRRQTGGELDVKLTPKGKAYFKQQLADAALSDDEFIRRGVTQLTPDEINRLIDESQPDYILRDGPRAAIGASTPEDIAAETARREASQQIREGKIALDFDASWAEINAPVPKSSVASARFGLAGRLGASQDPDVRKLGRLLVEDVLPDSDGGVVRNSASEWKRREYNRRMTPVEISFNNSFSGWAKERNLRAFWNSPAEDEFFTEVTRTVRRGKGTSGNAHVEKAADVIRSHMADMLETAKRHGVRGFDDIPTNPNYIHRWLHKPRIDRAVAEYGEDNVINLIQGSLFSGRPDIDPKLARRIAAGYYKRIQAIGEFSDIERGAVFATDAREALASQLRELVSDISEDEIAAVLGTFRKTGNDTAASIPRAKHRLQLDDSFSMALTDGRVMRFDDLLNNNARQIVRKYTSDVLGASAMSEVYRVTARTGGLAATNASALLNRIARSMRESGVPEPEVGRTLNRLDTAMRHIDGRPLSEDATAAAIARSLRDFNTARLGGRFAIAQIGDLASAVAHTGWRTLGQHVPTLRSVIHGARSGVFDNELAGELQRYWAFGNEQMLNTLSARFDFTGDAITDTTSRVGRATSRVAGATIRASGLAWIDAQSRRLTAIGMIEKWSKYADSGRLPSAKRLAGMGLSEDDAKSILAQMKEHRSTTTGVLGKKISALNIDEWDQAVAARFIAAIDKTARRLVQQQDIGQMSQWMTTWWGRSIIQFRGFGIGAYEKHLLYNLHMRDWESAMTLFYGMAFGGMSYAAVVVLNAAGRPDREEYLQKNLSPARLAAGAWQRSNTSGILPPFIDTGLVAGGFDPWFSQGRTTGLGGDALWGNPTADLLSSLRAARLLRAPLDPNFNATQADARALRNLIPFQNFYGVQQMLDALQYSLPTTQESE